MSVLRNLESKLAELVEGTFSRAFKSEVRPVEIARKLAREMDEHRVQSLSRTYAPNEYAVWLSPEDREQFSGYEDELREELSGYLLEHARRERVALLTAPEIAFKTDERLRLGEFGIQARLVRPGRGPRRGAAPGGGGPHDGLLVGRADRRAAARARPAARQPRGCGSAAGPSCSAPAARRSAARATPTSSSTTRTCRASTPRSGRPAERGSCATWAPRTASRSTGGGSIPRGRSRCAAAT